MELLLYLSHILLLDSQFYYLQLQNVCFYKKRYIYNNTLILFYSYGRKKAFMMCICLLIFPNIGLTFVTDYMIFVILRCVSGFAVGGLLGTGFVLGKLLRIMYGQFSNFDFIFNISCSKLMYENCHVQYLNIFVGESIRSKNSQNTYSRILNFGTSFLFVRVLLKIFFLLQYLLVHILCMKKQSYVSFDSTMSVGTLNI